MAAAIMEHPAEKKKAIISGQCLSAAVIPLLAFDLRVANRNAEIMIHRTEVAPTRGETRWTAAELAGAVQDSGNGRRRNSGFHFKPNRFRARVFCAGDGNRKIDAAG